MFDLSKNIALVTGGSSGLGSYFAGVLARHGARTVVTGRRLDRLQQVVSQIRKAGGEADCVAMDVKDADSISAAFDRVEAAWGTVDVLINNAGIAEPKTMLKVSEEEWDRVVDTNLKGSWIVAVEAARRMTRADRAGSIVNIASILALGVSVGQGTYSITKAGVVQMTKALALELTSRRIRVNALCPGYFQTEMNAEFLDSEQGVQYIANTTAGRLGKLEELAAPFLLLASDAGSFVNGITLPVDGGHLVQSL